MRRGRTGRDLLGSSVPQGAQKCEGPASLLRTGRPTRFLTKAVDLETRIRVPPRPRLLSQKPSIARHAVPNGLVLTLSGNWSLDEGPDVEHCIEEIVQAGAGRRHLVLDLAPVRRLDTLGAWAIVRVRQELGERECSVVLMGAERRAQGTPH